MLFAWMPAKRMANSAGPHDRGPHFENLSRISSSKDDQVAHRIAARGRESRDMAMAAVDAPNENPYTAMRSGSTSGRDDRKSMAALASSCSLSPQVTTSPSLSPLP